jgi:hypothetical protein
VIVETSNCKAIYAQIYSQFGALLMMADGHLPQSTAGGDALDVLHTLRIVFGHGS